VPYGQDNLRPITRTPASAERDHLAAMTVQCGGGAAFRDVSRAVIAEIESTCRYDRPRPRKHGRHQSSRRATGLSKRMLDLGPGGCTIGP